MSSKTQSSKARAGILSVSTAAILWGTVGIATQAIYLGSDLSSVTVGFFRLFFAFPMVAFLCWKIVGKQRLQIDRRQYKKMVLIGIMLALYQVFYFASIRYVGVAIATLVTLCTAPVLVSLLSVVFLKERLTIYSVSALCAALLGTVLLVGLPEQGTAQQNIIHGIALALGSATGYAIVTLMGRTLMDCSPILSTTVSFGVGAVFLFPFAAANAFSVAYSVQTWGLILYVGLVPTAVAYTLFFLGMRSIKASTASILTLLEPLTATILAWIVFAERLAPSGLMGAFLLLAAIAVLYRGEKSALSHH